MRLELRWSQVDALGAGPAHRALGRRLTVDLDGLRALARGRSAARRASGSTSRTRARPAASAACSTSWRRGRGYGGEDFPGVLGALGARRPAGARWRWRGVAVVATDQQLENPARWPSSTCRGRWRRSRSSAARANLVISAWPAAGAGRWEYQAAVRLAALKAAVHLARAAREAAARRVEVFELPPRRACPPSSLTCRAWRTSSRSTRTSGRPASTRASSTAIRCAACCRRSSIPTRCSTAPCCAASWAAASPPGPPRTIR